MAQKKIDGFILEEAVVRCPECQQPFTTDMLVESRKVNTSDVIEADLHRVFNDSEIRAALLSCCPACKYCAWSSAFKPFALKPELVRKESKMEPSKKYALAVKWARQKKVHSLDIAFIALNGLWCTRESNEPDGLWLELAIFENEKGIAGSPQCPSDDGMTHLMMGELYRQHRDFEKAVREYKLAEEDKSVSKEILSHLSMMASKNFAGLIALPLRLARLYFEIEEAPSEEAPLLDFEPTETTAVADNVAVADTRIESVTVADLPSDMTADEPKIKFEAPPKEEPTTFSTEDATSPEPAAPAAPLLAAISTLFSNKSSFLDAYANIDFGSEEEEVVAVESSESEHVAEKENVVAAAAAPAETSALNSLSEELTKAASDAAPPVVTSKKNAELNKSGVSSATHSSGESAFVPKSDRVAPSPAAAAPAPTAPANAPIAAQTEAAPIAEKHDTDNRSKKLHPTNEVIPPLAVADPEARAKTQAAAAAAAASTISVPVIRPAGQAAPAPSSPLRAAAPLSVPIIRPSSAPAAMRPAAYMPPSTPYIQGANAQALEVEAAPYVPAVQEAEIDPDTAPYIPGAHTSAQEVVPIKKPELSQSSSSVSISLTVSAAAPGQVSIASQAAAPKAEAAKTEAAITEDEQSIHVPSSIQTAPSPAMMRGAQGSSSAAQSNSRSAQEQPAPAPAAAQAAVPAAQTAQPAQSAGAAVSTRKRSKRAKPPREDHHFARHPVAVNQAPNHYGWVNDYGNSIPIDPYLKAQYQSTMEERAEPTQKPREEVRPQAEARQAEAQAPAPAPVARREAQAPAQQQIDNSAETVGAPLPGLAIEDPIQGGRDYSDAINRVENYLSFSRRVYSARNFSKL